MWIDMADKPDIMKKIILSCGELQIEPKGVSMKPYLKEGRDKVTIVPRKKYKMFDIVLYKKRGVYILHRVVGIKDGVYTIAGDNSPQAEDIKADEIIGSVKEITRFGKIKANPYGRAAELWIYVWYKLKLKNMFMRTKKYFGKKK